MNIGGGLIFPALDKRLRVPVANTPSVFQPPDSLGNWEYFRPPENQGPNPWCAAYGENAILQAAAWRKFGYPIDYSEEATYKGAKALDRDDLDGTSLDSVISAASEVAKCKIEAKLVEHLADIPWAIHQFGAVLVGLQIDEGWLKPRSEDGLVRPAGKSLGGHALVVSWYNNPKERLGGPNWWGLDWGYRGYWSTLYEDFINQFIYGYAQTITFQGDSE